MIGLMSLSIDTPTGASMIYAIGDLNMHESSPVLVDSVKRTIYNTNPFNQY